MKSSDALQTGVILASGTVMTVAGGTLRRLHLPAERWGLEAVLGAGMSFLGLAVVGLWFLALALAVVAELLQRRGRRTAGKLAARCTPAVMRRLAAALLGINLLTVPATAQAVPDRTDSVTGSAVLPGSAAAPGTPARASDGGSMAPAEASPSLLPVAGARDRTQDDRVGPTRFPEEPVSPAWKPSPMPPDGGLMVRPGSRATVHAEEVVVKPGDSLWSIVAGRLGQLATAADIAEAWPAWFDTNRAVIGDDPAHLVPGQVLQAPPH